MALRVTVNENGAITCDSTSFKIERSYKGKSLLSIPQSYVSIDIETTGLDPKYCEIIELGALRVENGNPIDRFNMLVKPSEPLDPFITELTGITDEMLANSPSIEKALPLFLDFIGENVLIGHNVNFDINFIYDDCVRYLGLPLKNDFVDTLRLARHAFPDLKNHKLPTLADYLKIQYNTSHRAMADCETVSKIASFLPEIHFRPRSTVKAKDITTDNIDFDTSHPLYGKICVFTGTLEKMVRKDAMQIVADLGGFCGDNVTSKTNFLILGNNDFCTSIKDGKSSKQKKAEKLMLEGKDLQIISENVFYDLIDGN